MDPEGPVPLDEIRRRRRTEAVRSALPYSPGWEAWLERTGDLAPDFGALVPRPRLWSPVHGLSGAGQWPERDAAIRDRVRHWLIGDWPTLAAAAELDVMDERRGDGVVERDLELVVGDGAAHLRGRLLLPEGGSSLPVVLCPAGRPWWGPAAVRRGWALCEVRVADGRDDSDALAFLSDDWSRLGRRAWALSRFVDALFEMPEVDPGAVVTAGHGADAHVALVAAAHDPRIAAVAAASAGVLGTVPARLHAERHLGPGIEGVTRHRPDWFHPRLRFFAGREHLLPTDAHELLALVAPRPVLISSARHDPLESTWALERTVDSVRGTYELLGAPAGTLGLHWRDGRGEVAPSDLDALLDWAEFATGRSGTAPPASRRLHVREGVSWPAPAGANRAPLDPRDLREEIADALGTRPSFEPRHDASPEPAHLAALLGRGEPPAGIVRRTVRTPDGLAVDVHAPVFGTSHPLILWLGPLARACGYAEGAEAQAPMWELLVRDGWAVVCLDLPGTGARIDEEAAFRRRHPGWSPLGRILADARAALDAAAALPGIGPGVRWVAGYGAGAVAALHVAALDPEISGLAAVAPAAGEVPLLAAEPSYGTADLLAALGSRPGLVVSFAVDADADAADTAAAVRGAAGERARVAHAVLREHNALSRDVRELVRAWLGQAAHLRAAA